MKKKIALTLVLLVVFFDWMGIGLVYPLFSSMLFHPEGRFAQTDISDLVKGVYLGVLLASMPSAQFFSSPILGALSDKWGRRPIFLITLLLGVFGYALSFFAVLTKSVLNLVISRLIVGISAGNVSIVSAAIADISQGRKRKKYYGFYSMACGIGFTLGPFLGGIFSEVSPLLPFFFVGLGILIILILIFFFFQETHLSTKEKKVQLEKFFSHFALPFKIPGLRVFLLVLLLAFFGWCFFFEFIPVRWIYNYEVESFLIGSLYLYGAFFFALSSAFFIRPILNRYNDVAVLFYTLFFLGGTFLLILLFPPAFFWVWIYLPVVNFFYALLYTNATSIVSNWAKPGMEGETLGMLQSVQSAAFAFSPLISGFILGHNPDAPLTIGSISMFLASLILIIFLRKYFLKNG